MEKMRLVILTIFSVISVSCSHALKVYSVEPSSDGAGLYSFSYHPWGKLIDDYGRGEDNVRAESRAEFDTAKKLAIWDQAHAEAELRYLEVNNLIPQECADGVVIVRSTQFENGGGMSIFRCK